MKIATSCLCFAVLIAVVKADTSTVNPLENLYKQTSEVIDQAVKKFQEATGLHTEFDKDKFVGFLKTSTSKFQDTFSKLVSQLEKDAKPYTEELKKSYENVVKQFNETIKNLNNADTQAKVQKLHETLYASLKKLAEQANEIAKSAGVQVPASMQKTLSEMYDELQKTSLKLQEKTQNLIADAQAELKKKKN